MDTVVKFSVVTDNQRPFTQQEKLFIYVKILGGCFFMDEKNPKKMIPYQIKKTPNFT